MIKQKEVLMLSTITDQLFIAYSATYGYIIEGIYLCPVFGTATHFEFSTYEFNHMLSNGQIVVIGEV